MVENAVEQATVSHLLQEKEERNEEEMGNNFKQNNFKFIRKNRLNFKLILIFVFYYNMIVLLLTVTLIKTCPYPQTNITNFTNITD